MRRSIRSAACLDSEEEDARGEVACEVRPVSWGRRPDGRRSLHPPSKPTTRSIPPLRVVAFVVLLPPHVPGREPDIRARCPREQHGSDAQLTCDSRSHPDRESYTLPSLMLRPKPLPMSTSARMTSRS